MIIKLLETIWFCRIIGIKEEYMKSYNSVKIICIRKEYLVAYHLEW